MGLSFAAMLVAACGGLVLVVGAIVQEGIDVAVILHALRALRALGDRRDARRHIPAVRTATIQFRAEHRQLQPWLDRIRGLADRLEPGLAANGEPRDVARFLHQRLLPHEQREEELARSALAKVVGGEDPLGAMRSTHLEIAHLARRYTKLVGSTNGVLSPEDVVDLRRVLYGLHAILRLHIAQEEELYAQLDDGTPSQSDHLDARYPNASIHSTP
jgi:hypothetical protein